VPVVLPLVLMAPSSADVNQPPLARLAGGATVSGACGSGMSAEWAAGAQTSAHKAVAPSARQEE
jgi:hypothetical protein